MAEVLYRKWRPRALDEVVGQDNVTNTLRNAVSGGRLAHAYLFCGPRGTGKTSTARILAKSVNCLSPSNGEPDNACQRCQAVNEGRALDLIEIDAASNRGIDDIRDLSDKINFAPTEFDYKVYIVDEVHMLTDQAFNALLKTLEEPPGHALFILATTEVHKVPLTIVSRCQRYDFRRIPLGAISAKLRELCAAEDVEAEDDALDVIARHSTGSLRDAENILEQAVVSYGSPLSVDQVRDMLELSGDEDALNLCEFVVRKNVPEGLGVIGAVAAQGSDLRELQRSVTDFLRRVMLVSAGAGEVTDFSDSVNERLKNIAEGADNGHILRALRAFSEADMRLDVSSPLPLELALVESAAEPVVAVAPAPQAAPASTPAAPSAPAPYAYQQSAPPSNASRRPPRRATPQPARTPAPAANGSAGENRNAAPAQWNPEQGIEPLWNDMLRALRNTGTRFKLGPLLRSSRERHLEGNQIIVKFAHSSHVERIREEIDNPSVSRELKEIVSNMTGAEYEISPQLTSDDNSSAMRRTNRSNPPLVNAAQKMGARLVDKFEEEVEE